MNDRISIKYRKEIPLLYSYAQLHVLTYKDSAIITTAKQGSSYLRHLAETIRGADKHTLSPSQKQFGNDIWVTEEVKPTTKLDLKILTELFNGKSKIKKILFLFRDPYKKITGGLYQDFVNTFPSEGEGVTLINTILSNQLKCKIDIDGLKEVMAYFERGLEFTNSYPVSLNDLESFVQDIFITYCQNQIHTGQILKEGHTKPWCADAIIWSTEFQEMGYDVKYFDIDSNEMKLGEVLNTKYSFKFEDSKINKASNQNVRKWFSQEKFIWRFKKPLNNILDYEDRAYQYMVYDEKRNLSFPRPNE